ncbi:hypothetical protein SKAU_G00087830 [Synaphobranchus kaupii]|uniref:Uncharacterized protein n=1 Tax=Synaphobranchus kaupii TaxID=118154 RepID=A0A9Q1FWY3_SYNKA|nr:hypothetical protein SKAU_G00087830 [Synaphobranchus kaupii]
MTPREKRRIALISVVVISLAVLCLALYFIPTFLYILLIIGVSYIVFFYHTNDPPSHSREGHHPRPNLIIPPLFRRWLPAKTANGVPSGVRVSRGRFVKGDLRDTVGLSSEKRADSTGLFRKETELSASSLFSPRDILMGSYLGKPDSPSAVGRFGGAETRELRERLSRPNHAVQTPNRRLSFGEPLGTAGRFTITPQRHYPIQKAGYLPMGMLAPAQWHGYKKKNILTPRNCPTVHSPVTVKIARPDHSSTRSPFLNHLGSPLGTLSPGLGLGLGAGAAADPCSRETVLSVLKESRKREVDDDEDRSYMDAQKSKRRRHGSSESSQSAFEPLTNGTPSHLVPKPGRMKRGMNTLVMEESLMKRSRTSSVSSLASGLAPSGVPGSVRNPIYSSYSSSQGTAQKKPSTLSLSPLSSPGSSRSQTPERPPKKPREEVAHSSNAAPASVSHAKSADQAASAGKKTPAPTAPVITSPSGSGGSEGKRKRKIPLVPSHRGENISLPPAPELGYTITVTDLDLEKKAALDRIKKALEEPEPVKPAPAPAVPTFPTIPVTSAAPPTSGGLLPGSIISISTSVIPTSTAASGVPVSEPSPLDSTSTAPASTTTTTAAPASSLSNPLLESLRKMKDSPASAPTPHGALVASTGLSAPAPSLLNSGGVKLEPSLTPGQPSLTLGQPSLTLGQPSLTPARPSLILAQPSLTPVQSSSAVAPTIQLPSSVSTAPFSQVLPQPAQSSAPFSQVLPQPAQSSAPAQPVIFSRADVKPPSSSSSAPAATETASGTINPLASAFKPIFGAGAGPAPPSSTSASTPAPPTFKPIFGSAVGGSAFCQPQTTTPAAPASSESSSLFGQISATNATSDPTLQTPAKSLFGSWSAASAPSTTTISAPTPATNGSSFQFGTTPAATSAPALNPTSTATPSLASFQFGASFTFGTPSSQTSTALTGAFGGFATATSTATGPAPASQSSFTFGKPSFDGPAAFPSAPQGATAKPFAFGSSGGGAGVATGATPFGFGGATTTSAPSFGTPSQPAFCGGTSGFGFGSATAPSTAPTFGSNTQTSAPLPTPTPTFSFGGAPAAQTNAPAPPQATPLQPASGGFNFGAAVAGSAFGTPTPANPSGLTQNFSFGGANSAKDSKPAFGTSTPSFGQNTGAPIPFGSPSFTPLPFGGSPAPAFSIGAGSKPSGARQRLQARRQHPRKK